MGDGICAGSLWIEVEVAEVDWDDEAEEGAAAEGVAEDNGVLVATVWVDAEGVGDGDGEETAAADDGALSGVL